MPLGLNRFGDYRKGFPINPGVVTGSDSFTYPNKTLLSSTGNWADQNGVLAVNKLVAIGNAVGDPSGGTGSGGGIARWIGAGSTATDLLVQITINPNASQIPLEVAALGVYVQPDNSTTDLNASGYYAGKIELADDNTHYTIVRSDSGSLTTLAISTVLPKLGDTIKFQIQILQDTSANLLFYVNNQLILSFNDPTPLSAVGSRPAILLKDTIGDDTVGFLDNFLIENPDTSKFQFGNPVTLPKNFGNVISTPVAFGNKVNWTPSPAHFGNPITDGGS